MYNDANSQLKGLLFRDEEGVELSQAGLIREDLNVKTVEIAMNHFIIGVKGKYTSAAYNSVFSNFQFITARVNE